MLVLMKETELDRCVQDLATLLGLKTMHIRPAIARSGKWSTPVQGDGVGWPDWVLVGPGGVLFRECKADTGRVRPEQEQWITALRCAGQNAKIWRPRDWHSGAIRMEMMAIRGKK